MLEQLEFSRGEAQRMVAEILARNKSVKTIEEFLRKVFEEKQSNRDSTVGTRE